MEHQIAGKASGMGSGPPIPADCAEDGAPLSVGPAPHPSQYRTPPGSQHSHGQALVAVERPAAHPEGS